MSLIDRYYYGGAGDSALRWHKQLVRTWQHRTLGRRATYYFWILLTLAVIAALHLTSSRWHFLEGLGVGIVGMSFLLLPDVLVPDHIARKQRGAWGEQNTARALRPLRKRGWLVRHDLDAGIYGNLDHVVAGKAVYLLDSKLLRDEVWLADDGLHVRRVDETEEEYVVKGLSKRMLAAKYALERDVKAAVGFGVAVYPVVVIWGYFDAKVAWDGSVAYADGDELAEWLDDRPADLLTDDRREAVKDWLRGKPRKRSDAVLEE